jgi:hypothetical protein
MPRGDANTFHLELDTAETPAPVPERFDQPSTRFARRDALRDAEVARSVASGLVSRTSAAHERHG